MSEFEDKVISLLEKINNKLDKLLNTSDSVSTSIKTTASSTGDEYVKPSALVEKQEEEQKAIEKPPVEGRRVCPSCGGTAFKTEEDKTQVLFQQGGMKIYAKNHICKSCGTAV